MNIPIAARSKSGRSERRGQTADSVDLNEVYQSLLRKALAKGYDVKKLQKTDQSCTL